jgi:uncharacterized membrane protein YfcA
MVTLDALQWVCAVLAALLVGVSKTALSGLGVLAVALLAYVFPNSKQASGFVLPMLVFADFVAVSSYRTHTQWRYLWKLFPWAAVGVVFGYFALGRISDRGARLLIGGIILLLVALSYWRRYRPASADDSAPVHWTVAIFVGILAGFVTLIANAASPLMAVYLVAMRLPKMQYVGTAAVFFMLLNLFKVPFMAALGLVTVASFKFNLMLLPAVLVGAAAGRWLLTRINQALFEGLVLALSAAAGLLLLL